MNYNSLLAHFGGLKRTAQALETSMQTVHQWKVRGTIPPKWQIKAYRRSDGRLTPNKKAREFAAEVGAPLT
jgi:hypothetical protein